MTKQLLAALLLSGYVSSVSSSPFEDDGTDIIYEALCSAEGSSTVSKWGNYLDDTRFNFVLKVKRTQVWMSEPDNVDIYNNWHDSNMRWNPITLMISKTAWDATGNWGVYVSSIDESLYFSRIDTQEDLIYSFIAKCKSLS